MPDFYHLLAFFAIYALLGWGAEVAFAALKTGHFVNRGFLNGPICPIYGCGMIVVIVCLHPIRDNLLILFAGSVILTSLLEYLTGFVLEKVFHDKWWDYSAEPFNLHGYICLRFSILWGLACVLIMNVIQPLIAAFVDWLPLTPGIVLLAIFSGALIADAGVTINSMFKLRRKLTLMNEISAALHELSDALGENIAEGVTDAVRFGNEKRDELADRTEDVLAELELRKQLFDNERAAREEEWQALRARYSELLSAKVFGQRRIFKAFPDLANGRNRDHIERLHQAWQEAKAQAKADRQQKKRQKNDSDKAEQ